MKFLWPISLILLTVIPLLALLFWRLQRRRRRFAVRFSSLALLRQALPKQSWIKRYLPAALFLLALTGLVVGLARPVTTIHVPAGRATVMLVMDVSQSMRQTDIAPSRLAAAQEAALKFIQRQQANNQIGIVAFASIAQLVQAPTTDSEALNLAIENLSTGRGTAIGSAILTAVDTIAEFNHNVAASNRGGAAQATATPVPEGEYAPDIVVLLTDGVYNTGPDPLQAAQQAVDRGVRVYTIGYGTENGTMDGGNRFGGGRRGIDEESLTQIAKMTGGKYYAASSASELQKVFASLPTYLNTREETTEISFVFVTLGALLLAAAVICAQLWHPLP